MLRYTLPALLAACSPTDKPPTETTDTSPLITEATGSTGETGSVSATGSTASTGHTGASSTTDTEPPAVVPDFSLLDENPTSPTYGQMVSPRDQLLKVSGWYFTHAT